jgi:hypothetical protein
MYEGKPAFHMRQLQNLLRGISIDYGQPCFLPLISSSRRKLRLNFLVKQLIASLLIGGHDYLVQSGLSYSLASPFSCERKGRGLHYWRCSILLYTYSLATKRKLSTAVLRSEFTLILLTYEWMSAAYYVVNAIYLVLLQRAAQSDNNYHSSTPEG